MVRCLVGGRLQLRQWRRESGPPSRSARVAFTTVALPVRPASGLPCRLPILMLPIAGLDWPNCCLKATEKRSWPKFCFRGPTYTPCSRIRASRHVATHCRYRHCQTRAPVLQAAVRSSIRASRSCLTSGSIRRGVPCSQRPRSQAAYWMQAVDQPYCVRRFICC